MTTTPISGPATAFTVGQRLGRLTVTQTSRYGTAEQVRCDCGTDIAVRLEFDFLAPPDEIGPYHVRYLLAAEAGRLRYNLDEYRIHGLPNNAADALWRGLLVDGEGGPVLTELGAHMLAHWKENQTGDETAYAGPPPFTDERAAWIREHAWTAHMRKTHGQIGRYFYSSCACQHGSSAHCEAGRCNLCPSDTPVRSYETVIVGRGGMPAYFPEPYTHDTDDVYAGPICREHLAMVWLADRVCRWVCPHDCHSAPAAPEQLDLFEEVSA